MNRKEPPPKSAAGQGSSPGESRRTNKNIPTRTYRPSVLSATVRYLARVWRRYENGLLSPFYCHRCGIPTLDPCGWDRPRKPLCESCSDRDLPPDPPEPKPYIHNLRPGTTTELGQFAAARGICPEALRTAQRMGTAAVAVVCKFPSIILFDQSGRCMEARRLDNGRYPPIDKLLERKAHTIRNSQKSWPVGLQPFPEYLESHRLIALVEGSADYFAALHFAQLLNVPGVLPVAVLSRALKAFHPQSLDRFRGRRIRILPHNDQDRGGYQGAVLWAKQLQKVDCEVDAFKFKGLRKADGSPVNDLNDCVQIAPVDSNNLQELFP